MLDYLLKNLSGLLSVTFSLFAIIDVVGTIPVLISIKNHHNGYLNEKKITFVSGILMIVFLYGGEFILRLFGLDAQSFAIGGSIVIFLLGLEMVLGHEIFKSDMSNRDALVPIAFPLIAGSGTLTTIISLRAEYEVWLILVAILLNLVIIFLTLRSLNTISKFLGIAGMTALRKFFGVILIALAIKIFLTSLYISTGVHLTNN